MRLLTLLLLAQFIPSPSPGVGGSVGTCTITATGISCATVVGTTSVTGALGKFDTLDAGTAYIAGQTQSKGQVVIDVAGPSGILFTDGNGANRIQYGTGRYMNFNVNGQMAFTGGSDGIDVGSIAFGTGALLVDTSTAPTVSAGGCTSPAISATGTAYFEVTVGTSCAGVSTFTVTAAAVSKGRICSCRNLTNPTFLVRHTGGNATTAVFTNYGVTVAVASDLTAGDVIGCGCRGG